MAPRLLAPPDVARLHATALDIVEVRVGALLRVGLRQYRSQAWFGRGPTYRFDAPDASYGVMYAGLDLVTCVAESILRDDARNGRCTLYESDLAEQVVTTFRPVTRRLRLVKLYGTMLELGIDGQISTCPDYAITQAWSSALHGHPEEPDGLVYASRLNTEGKAVAVFERAGRGLEERTRVSLTQHPHFVHLANLSGLEVLP